MYFHICSMPAALPDEGFHSPPDPPFPHCRHAGYPAGFKPSLAPRSKYLNLFYKHASSEAAGPAASVPGEQGSTRLPPASVSTSASTSRRSTPKLAVTLKQQVTSELHQMRTSRSAKAVGSFLAVTVVHFLTCSGNAASTKGRFVLHSQSTKARVIAVLSEHSCRLSAGRCLFTRLLCPLFFFPQQRPAEVTIVKAL